MEPARNRLRRTGPGQRRGCGGRFRAPSPWTPGSTPCSRIHRIISGSLKKGTRSMGVSPTFSTAYRSAPCLFSHFIAPRRLLRATQCMGAMPWRVPKIDNRPFRPQPRHFPNIADGQRRTACFDLRVDRKKLLRGGHNSTFQDRCQFADRRFASIPGSRFTQAYALVRRRLTDRPRSRSSVTVGISISLIPYVSLPIDGRGFSLDFGAILGYRQNRETDAPVGAYIYLRDNFQVNHVAASGFFRRGSEMRLLPIPQSAGC